MNFYQSSNTTYKRLITKEVKIGDLLLGNGHPIRVQTMTTTDTMDTAATVAQAIRCIEAGAELVRITAPSKKEAENLLAIKNELRKKGYTTPLIADIHFTPNAAEIAAAIVEKVRVNPGNYVDKKKFEQIIYTDAEYAEEIERITTRFTPLVKICKDHGTAMRIGTNHGSLSDRIMSRYGDTPIGMVESALEFLRIARYENYHNIMLSMKSSNPQVMVQAYRLLVKMMMDEFGECYPLHLGVTEAGSGDDGRIKSAIGIGSLLEDGIGDTIRVSLTEDPEFEIPVCKNLVKRYEQTATDEKIAANSFSTLPATYTRRKTFAIKNIGNKNVPIVIADLSKLVQIKLADLKSIGYSYQADLDKWNIADTAADYIYTGTKTIDFELPGTLKIIIDSATFNNQTDEAKYHPVFDEKDFITAIHKHSKLNFVMVNAADTVNSIELLLPVLDDTVVLSLYTTEQNVMPTLRKAFGALVEKGIENPVVLLSESYCEDPEETLIIHSIECGALFLDGFGDGISLGVSKPAYEGIGQVQLPEMFLNNIAFTILQATRTRISKTEYISCPSCGRTLFDLQETTSRIRARTHHLKGVKIAIMGCIVNGPGEMADADFGYVGSGVGKISLYKGKELVKRNIDSEVAVDELIGLLRENDAWIEP